MECVCLVPGCGAEFVVPIWFNAPDRPINPPPDMCDDCRAEENRKLEERLKREDEARAAHERALRHVDTLAAMEQAGGNPYQFGGFTMEDFPATAGQKKAMEAAREWTTRILDSRDKYEKVRGLYLVGPPGTAKTQILHLVLRELIAAGMKPGRDVIFDDSLSLIQRIQGTYGSDESTWVFLEARINARVWMLDDFMAEKPTDDVIQKLTLLFNRREGKPTGVTSNEMPDALASRHKEAFRLLSRLGTAQFRVVSVQSEDRRFGPTAA